MRSAEKLAAVLLSIALIVLVARLLFPATEARLNVF